MIIDASAPRLLLRRRQLLKGALAGAAPLALPSLAFAAAEPLVVGGLPVTCNLTLPVACMAKATSNARAGSSHNAFDKSFIGVTGTARQIDALLKSYGITATKRMVDASKLDYTMHHSSYLYFIDRHGMQRAMMPFGRPSSDFVHDLHVLRKQ